MLAHQIMFKFLLLALCIAPAALASAGIKGGYVRQAESSQGIKGPAAWAMSRTTTNYGSPAVKGKLISAAPVPQAAAPGAVLVPNYRHVEQAPISGANEEWQTKQESILQQQRDQLSSIVREQKVLEESHRLEQNRLAERISQQHLEVVKSSVLGLEQPQPSKTSISHPIQQQAIKTEELQQQQLSILAPSPTKSSYVTKHQEEPIQQIKQEPFIEQQRQEVSQQQQRPQEVAEPEPYAFSYHLDNSARSESGDTKGVVRGYYRLNGPDGSNRLVEYIADQQGFRATIKTNEFGTEPRSPANTLMLSSQPLQEDLLRANAVYEQKQAPAEEYEGGSKGGVVVKNPESPIARAPVVPVLAPIIQQQQVVRSEDRKIEQQHTSQQELEQDQVQIIKSVGETKSLPLSSSSVPRAAKSLELAAPAPAAPQVVGGPSRNFASATSHKPALQSDPVSSHRASFAKAQEPTLVDYKVRAAPGSPVNAPPTYSSSSSEEAEHASNAGFEHPVDE